MVSRQRRAGGTGRQILLRSSAAGKDQYKTFYDMIEQLQNGTEGGRSSKDATQQLTKMT